MLNKNEKKVWNISFWLLLKFSFKSVVLEKSFMILNLVVSIFSLGFSFYTSFLKSGKEVVIAFDYYTLIFISSLLFIIILRVLQFFFNRKFEDKTMYIVISNQVSRKKIFIAQWSLIVIVSWANVLFGYLIINFNYLVMNQFEVNDVLVRKTTVFLLYTFVVSVCLINFMIFLLLLTTPQITMIASTLLLSFSFIANLPLKFLKTKEENELLVFNMKNTNRSQQLTVSSLYDTFNLQKYINSGNIKYNYLAKSLNDFILENKFEKGTFSSKDNIEKRLNNYWKELGLIDEKTREFKKLNATLMNSPNELKGWDFNDPIEIDMKMNNLFINDYQLENVILNEIDQNKKNVLKDFYDFSKSIQAILPDLQKQKAELFNDFIYVDEANSFMENKNKNKKLDKVTFTTSYLKSIYKYYFTSAASPTDLTVSSSTEVASFMENNMYFPLMLAANIVEKYLVDYATIYQIATENPVIQEQGQWKTYKSGRDALEIFSYVSPFFGIWSTYTYFSGYSFKDFWFSPYSSSKIILDNQDNLFLPYVQYTFNLNDDGAIKKETYNDFLNPIIFIGVQLGIAATLMFITGLKFTRRDLK